MVSFPHLPLTDQGSTRNFEVLQRILPDGIGPLDRRYLLTASEKEAKWSSGLSEVEWPGGANASNQTTVSGITGLTTTRFWAQAIAAGRIWFAVLISPGVTEFKAQGYCPTEKPAAGTKEKFYWLALTE